MAERAVDSAELGDDKVAGAAPLIQARSARSAGTIARTLYQRFQQHKSQRRASSKPPRRETAHQRLVVVAEDYAAKDGSRHWVSFLLGLSLQLGPKLEQLLLRDEAHDEHADSSCCNTSQHQEQKEGQMTLRLPTCSCASLPSPAISLPNTDMSLTCAYSCATVT
jgi:hypothetical protein